MSAATLLRAVRTNPVALTRQLWLWEWHALVIWAFLAAVGTPVLFLILTPLFRRLLLKVEKHQYPVVPAL
jgi:hypothetical protein